VKKPKARIDFDPKTGQRILEEESQENLATKHGLIFYLVMAIIWLPMMLLYRPRILGRKNIPREGGVVLAVTHTSALDSPLVAVTAGRKPFFLARSNLFRGWLSPLMRRVGAIPVDRSRRNKRALDLAVEKLRTGAVIVVFPEGTINVNKELMPFKLGAVKMAQSAGVPLVPVAISGRYSLLRRIYISYGEPMTVTGDLEAANQELIRRITVMRAEQRSAREPKQHKGWLQTLLKPLLIFLVKIIYRPQIVGRKNIPSSGPTIIVSNHKDDLDPFLIMSGRPRRNVQFLAKHECTDWQIGPLIAQFGVIFVDRTAADKHKVHQTVGQTLRAGKSIVALFPEGTRNKTSAILMPFKPGAVRYAADNGAVIVPAVIIGQYRPFRRGPKIIFGPPFKVEPDANLAKINQKLYNKIEQMLISGGEREHRPQIYKHYQEKEKANQSSKGGS